MQHFDHPHTNGDLGPAPGDEDSVDTLRVQHGIVDGARYVRSFWRPTLHELALLQAGGSVTLTVLASTHAPLRLDVVEAV